MTGKPVTTYVVSVFEKPHWRTVLTTKDKAKAGAVLKNIGKSARIEEITRNTNTVSKLREWHGRVAGGLL